MGTATTRWRWLLQRRAAKANTAATRALPLSVQFVLIKETIHLVDHVVIYCPQCVSTS